MCVIGVTGSFGSGKTTVAQLLRRRGAKVVDADQVAHQMLAPKEKCFRRVVRCFGKEVLTRGCIDRGKLAAIVFHDPRALKKLSHIMHPAIIQRLKQEVRSHRRSLKHRWLVLDIPLLFETRSERLCDHVVVVRSSLKTQIARLRKRNHFTQSEILRRIKAQMPIALKAAKADFVIYNQGSIQKTKKQVEELCLELKKKKM